MENETRNREALPEEGDLLTANQVTRILHISPSTLIRWRREGTGPAYLKIGGRFHYRRTAITDFIQSEN